MAVVCFIEKRRADPFQSVLFNKTTKIKIKHNSGYHC